MASNAEWGIFDADIQMRMVWPECYLLLNFQISSLFLIDFSIKLSNISHCFLIVIPLLIPMMSSMISLWFPLISRFPPCWSWWWSRLFLFLIVLPIILHVDPGFLRGILLDFTDFSLSSSLSSLISHVILPVSSLISLFFLCFPPWSWWWSWLNLSDDVLPLLLSARWWCFLSVLSLRSDYRGWLLIIFILTILLWWPLFLSF